MTAAFPRLFRFPMPGMPALEAAYEVLRAQEDRAPLVDRLLEHLRVRYRASERDLEHVPAKGPVVVVANHPFGILDGAVLAALLGGIRRDVKVLANGVLAGIPEIRDLVIPVDPMGGAKAKRVNPSGIRRALEFLEGGGLLVVFPAGEVSHFQWKERKVTDPEWSPTIARLLALASSRAPGLTIVPAHIEGHNSVLFQMAGLAHPRIRTALLARELMNKRGALVEVRLGSGIPVEKLLAIPTDAERTNYLRWRTYLLANRRTGTARMSRTRAEEITGAVSPDELATEVERLTPMARSGELAAYVARAEEIPAVLAEIGRLREITFRAAGEGTGSRTDLDSFDLQYLHLFVWNGRKREVVGAYRLAGTDRVSRLYTATLFKYGREFLDRMGPALELGRSFVRQEYQKGFAPLLLLWKGIGAYVAENPRYKILFGPVSISNQYQAVSRELMVSYLERHASLRDWMNLVGSRNPFRGRVRAPEAGFDLEDLSAVVSDLEPSRAGVPVLLRQYLKLGGKLLGFNVDGKFSNALDGLILVDLTQTEPRLLERYFGKQEAAQFFAYQKGHYGAQSRVPCCELGAA